MAKQNIINELRITKENVLARIDEIRGERSRKEVMIDVITSGYYWANQEESRQVLLVMLIDAYVNGSIALTELSDDELLTIVTEEYSEPHANTMDEVNTLRWWEV